MHMKLSPKHDLYKCLVAKVIFAMFLKTAAGFKG